MNRTIDFIPFNRASTVGNEMQYVREVIESGKLSGDGLFSRKCAEILTSITRSKKALLTTSCTSALDMSAILLNLRKGDEVIVPSFTFVSTANSFATHGAKIVFADIREDTLNLDEKKIESLITDRTVAIVPVHYAGVGCDMDEIINIAKRNRILVIEDNAHGLMGSYKKVPLGGIGDLATLSFHETKNYSCGEGGALLINNPKFIERAEIIREKGTDRSKFFRGEVDKYTWVDFGSSFLLSEILSAYLLAQLENREIIQAKRKLIWERYYDGLEQWANESGVRLPFIPSDCEQSFHMFYLILPDEQMRNKLLDYLRSKNILSVFHYLPLHSSIFAKKQEIYISECPVTDKISKSLCRLPLHLSLSENEQEYIIESITRFSGIDKINEGKNVC